MKKQTCLRLCSFACIALFVLVAGCATHPKVIDSTKAYNLADVDIKPMAKGEHATPEYPFEMSEKGISGYVILQITVDTAGVPRDIAVIRSSEKVFEAPAIAAVEKWRYSPAKKDDATVKCKIQFPIIFEL